MITMHCDSLCSDISGVKFLMCFMKRHVNVSSLTTGEVYKLRKIRRILVWLWVDLNQFGIPNYLTKALGLQLKPIQILGLQIESYKSPEKNSRVFHENSAIFYTCSWKGPALTTDVPILEHLMCFTKHVKRECEHI